MRNFFYKFILPPVLLALVGVLAFGVTKQAKRNYDMHAQISELAGEAKDIEEQNEELRAEIENFQDPSTIDKEARRRLNLKKDGEEVVIILPPQGEKDNIVEEPAIEKPENKNFFWKIMKSWFE